MIIAGDPGRLTRAVDHLLAWSHGDLAQVADQLKAQGDARQQPESPSRKGTLSDRLRLQIGRINQAMGSGQGASAMLGTAAGALNDTQDLLARMRQLAEQGKDESLSKDDRDRIGDQLAHLSDQLDKIGKDTEFQGHKLLDGGDYAKHITISLGVDSADTRTIGFSEVSSASLKVDVGSLCVASTSFAVQTLANIDQGLKFVSNQQDYVKEQQNGLSRQVQTLSVQAQNLTQVAVRMDNPRSPATMRSGGSGDSQDTDSALSASQLARQRILDSTRQALVSQANSPPETLLRLLGG